jgi:hypothetical protein
MTLLLGFSGFRVDNRAPYFDCVHHEDHEGHEGFGNFVLKLRALRVLRGEYSSTPNPEKPSFATEIGSQRS